MFLRQNLVWFDGLKDFFSLQRLKNMAGTWGFYGHWLQNLEIKFQQAAHYS
jgi:hypothetical protein